MIGIHHTTGSFSERWMAYCKARSIAFKVVDLLATDAIAQCDGLGVVLWHWFHTNSSELLVARAVLASLERRGAWVYPNSTTCWHFDDKVAQKYLLEATGAPLIRTWVFTRKSEAAEWIGTASWPKVFKLRCGAGSTNVRLVRSRAMAESLCRQAFGSGFPSVASYFTDLPTRLRRTQNAKHLRQRLTRAPGILVERLRSRIHGARERGYVYFQEFLPDNAFDTRITVIGDRAFGYRRLNRPNDFRASGSGEPRYEPEGIDIRCVQTAFEVARRLGTQSLAFDFLFDPNRQPMIGEISYCFVDWMVHACPGHWDRNLRWHEGHTWPQEAVMEDVLVSSAAAPDASSATANA